jgi:hypothetical protein
MATTGQRPRYAGTPRAAATNPYRAPKESAPTIIPPAVERPISSETVSAVETKLTVPTPTP